MRHNVAKRLVEEEVRLALNKPFKSGTSGPLAASISQMDVSSGDCDEGSSRNSDSPALVTESYPASSLSEDSAPSDSDSDEHLEPAMANDDGSEATCESAVNSDEPLTSDTDSE